MSRTYRSTKQKQEKIFPIIFPKKQRRPVESKEVKKQRHAGWNQDRKQERDRRYSAAAVEPTIELFKENIVYSTLGDDSLQTKPIQWLNYFSTTIYHNSKVGPKELVPFCSFQWGTGSHTWNFKPRVPNLTKSKFVLHVKGEQGQAPLELFPKWNFVKKRREPYVPARYLYLISSTWTPYYITFFYLAKIWHKGMSPKQLWIRKKKKQWKYSENKATAVIVKFLKGVVDSYKNVSYKNPYPLRFKSWFEVKTLHNSRLQRRHRRFYIENKRLSRFLKRPYFYRHLTTAAFKRWLKNKQMPFLLLRKVKSAYRDRKKIYIRNYLRRYVYVNNFLFKAGLNKQQYTWKIQNRLRSAHRFGSAFWTKKIFFMQWIKYMFWFVINQKKYSLVHRTFIPHVFLHAQKNPKRYYSISRWNNQTFQWLNIVLHNRQLFPFQLQHCFTRETRHPHRCKSWQAYKWFMYTTQHQWLHTMVARKNYRLKQILFGRIVLPALDYLKQKQFVQIKKNTAHIKPLALVNSRPGNFLGKFERRIDILTYKLNFAPTIQWARVFVEAGLIYVSYWTHVNKNYRLVLTKQQKFPILSLWRDRTLSIFNNLVSEHLHKRKNSFLSQRLFNMPLPITLVSYRVMLKGIVYWTNSTIKTWFYYANFQRNLPSYFIFNKTSTVGYFWRNLNVQDIDKLKRSRIKKNTFNWLA